MSFEALSRLPRSNRRRLVGAALACFIEFSIFFPLVAGSGAVNGNPSVVGWPLGLWLWALSLALVILYLAGAVAIKRAIVFYALEHGARGLGMMGLLALGLSMTAHLFGRDVLLAISGGVAVGWTTMATRIPAKRRWFEATIERGHLVKSLDHEKARWSTRYDLDQAAKELRDLEDRSCLVRLLPWIGPAIGMALAGVFGMWNTMVMVALIAIGLGYWGFGVLSVSAIARILELRRLEKVLGRPIILAEDVAAKRA